MSVDADVSDLLAALDDIPSIRAWDWLFSVVGLPDAAPVLPDVPYEMVMDVARFHRLEDRAMVAWGAACEAAGEPVPTALTAELQAMAIRTMMWSGHLGDAMDAITAAGAIAVPLKGPVLATLTGAGALRRCQDLDILLRPEDLDAGRAALRTLGYEDRDQVVDRYMPLWCRVNYEWTMVRPADGALIELHWGLMPPYMAIPARAEDVLARCTTVEADGRVWPWLSPEDNILFLCVHGQKHAWRRMRLADDLVGCIRACPDLDVARLQARARDWRIERILAIGLRIAQMIYPSIPPELAAIADADGAARRFAVELASAWPACKKPLHARDLYPILSRSRECRRDRLRMYWRLITHTAPPDWAWLPLPPSLHWAYPVIRPFRLALRR